MNKNNSNKVLFKRIDFLLDQYDQLISNCIEVIEDVDRVISDENSNEFEKEEMFSYLNSTDDGRDLIRLSTTLAYMMAPQDQGAVNDLADDIFRNNLVNVNSIDDLLELYDLKRKIAVLVELGIIEVSDIKINCSSYTKTKKFLN